MSLPDLALDILTWAFPLGAIYIFYRTARAEEKKAGLMEELLSRKEKDDFLLGVSELVSTCSPRLLPGFSQERLFDEPRSDDENEYYNFFHYHVVTTLTDSIKARSSSGIYAMASIGVVLLIGGIFILMIGAPSFSLATAVTMLPLLMMVVAMPIFFRKLYRALRREMDLLVKVDDRYTELMSGDRSVVPIE